MAKERVGAALRGVPAMSGASLRGRSESAPLYAGTYLSQQYLHRERTISPVSTDRQSTNRPGLKELFMTSERPFADRPLIGMIHLPPLNDFSNRPPTVEELRDLREKVHSDLQALDSAGFHGVMVENNLDNPRPTPQDPMSPYALDVYNQLVGEVARLAHGSGMKVGVHIGYDPEATLRSAHMIGADFVRVDVFADTMTSTDYPGLTIKAAANEFIAYNKELEARYGQQMLVLADVQVKHWKMEDPAKSLDASIEDTIQAGADAVVITSNTTGVQPDLIDVKHAAAIAGGRVSVLLGSGITAENCAPYLSVAKGVIIGSSLQKIGNATHDVDPERARNFVIAVREQLEEDSA